MSLNGIEWRSLFGARKILYIFFLLINNDKIISSPSVPAKGGKGEIVVHLWYSNYSRKATIRDRAQKRLTIWRHNRQQRAYPGEPPNHVARNCSPAHHPTAHGRHPVTSCRSSTLISTVLYTSTVHFFPRGDHISPSACTMPHSAAHAASRGFSVMSASGLEMAMTIQQLMCTLRRVPHAHTDCTTDAVLFCTILHGLSHFTQPSQNTLASVIPPALNFL